MSEPLGFIALVLVWATCGGILVFGSISILFGISIWLGMSPEERRKESDAYNPQW